jgi:uncharacterized protein (DUF433 family)
MNNKTEQVKQNEIVTKQQVRFGKPVIENTRIAVEDIYNLLKAGYEIKDIPGQFPGITQNGITKGLETKTQKNTKIGNTYNI